MGRTDEDSLVWMHRINIRGTDNDITNAMRSHHRKQRRVEYLANDWNVMNIPISDITYALNHRIIRPSEKIRMGPERCGKVLNVCKICNYTFTKDSDEEHGTEEGKVPPIR